MAKAEAESSIARSRAEIDERRRRLEEELASLREEAETRMREIHADTETIWEQRDGIVDDIPAEEKLKAKAEPATAVQAAGSQGSARESDKAANKT